MSSKSSKLVWGPTYEEMLYPERVESGIRERASKLSIGDGNAGANGDGTRYLTSPTDLFNITWKQDNGKPSYAVLPKGLTGVNANIIVLYARDFPTRSHKVGATYSVTMEKQLAGEIVPGKHSIVFPSTGNYAIGGAWVGPRMGYDTIAVLPELMSKERFDLIESYGSKCVKTPGSESRVKEIYDKCRELSANTNVAILNQFEEMANYRFHYYVTGNTVCETVSQLEQIGIGDGKCAAFVSAIGSGGTIAAGDRVKQVFPGSKTVGLEPIQCSTLYNNGYGDHEIQGIGDKHVTWIHNTYNMDCLICIDDNESKIGLQLLTDPIGMEYLSREAGIPIETVKNMATMFGISGVCNVLGAIKLAKFYGLEKHDNIVTVLTDSIDRYRSVMADLDRRLGEMTWLSAAKRFQGIFADAKSDHVQEGTKNNKDRWFNLKYFTWVQQQGKTVEELDAQRDPLWWVRHQQQVAKIDALLKQARGF